jgi:Domain of unknown function (DUF5655)
MAWTCPRCGRTFGRANQSHSCVPMVPLDEWLDRRDPQVSAVLAAMREALTGLEPVSVETTKSALMIKRARTFAELKPHREWIDVGFIVSRTIDDPRIDHTLDLTRTRIVHVVRVTGPDQVDDQLGQWLREAFASSPVED